MNVDEFEVVVLEPGPQSEVVGKLRAYGVVYATKLPTMVMDDSGLYGKLEISHSGAICPLLAERF